MADMSVTCSRCDAARAVPDGAGEVEWAVSMRTDPACEHVAGVVHACPRGDEGITTCCQRPPFELAVTDRMSLDPNLVTCNR